MVELNPALQEASFVSATWPLQSLLSSPWTRAGRNRFCWPRWTWHSSLLIGRVRGLNAFCFAVCTQSNAICYQPHAAALESQFAEGQARGNPTAASSFCPATADCSMAPGFAELSGCCQAAADYCKTVNNRSCIIKPCFPSWERTH